MTTAVLDTLNHICYHDARRNIMSDDSWPTELDLAMQQAGTLGPPPSVDPPLPPHQPGHRPTHREAHVYEFKGDSKTQPYTHVWSCIVVGVKSGRACSDEKTLTCTKFADRYEPCRCFGEGNDGR